jgi:hypothetical protein
MLNVCQPTPRHIPDYGNVNTAVIDSHLTSWKSDEGDQVYINH